MRICDPCSVLNYSICWEFRDRDWETGYDVMLAMSDESSEQAWIQLWMIKLSWHLQFVVILIAAGPVRTPGGGGSREHNWILCPLRATYNNTTQIVQPSQSYHSFQIRNYALKIYRNRMLHKRKTTKHILYPTSYSCLFLIVKPKT